MRKLNVSSMVRSGGYEILFLLGQAVALSVNPNVRNAKFVQTGLSPQHGRYRNVPNLRKRGLVESEGRGTREVLRLTELGQRVFEGGRRPEEEWGREWDGQWRLLSFDIPRKANVARLRFWRWLRANHFGCLQGSVWVSPDPVPMIETAAKKAGFSPSNVLVFTGSVTDGLAPKQVVAKAWNINEINKRHRRYRDFAEESENQVRGKAVSPERLAEMLAEDHRLWWRSMRLDPLLPKSLMPRQYEGVRAWKSRQKLHTTLFGCLAAPEND